jgi:hypothetical protein
MNSTMHDFDTFEEFSHPRLVEPVMASSGKIKEKRRTLWGAPFWEKALAFIKLYLRLLQLSVVCNHRWF